MSNEEPLVDIDDEVIESGYLDEIKKDHFAAGIHITYAENPTDPNPEFYIREFPDGRKVRVHHSELGRT